MNIPILDWVAPGQESDEEREKEEERERKRKKRDYAKFLKGMESKTRKEVAGGGPAWGGAKKHLGEAQPLDVGVQPVVREAEECVAGGSEVRREGIPGGLHATAAMGSQGGLV